MSIYRDVYSACIYTRLSRDDSDKDEKAESNSITNQKALIRDFLNGHPEIEIVSEHEDDGYSGVNFDRPGFNAMMDEIRSGKVNCVVVKDLSRFGRNYIEAGNYIERVFPFMNVRFIAINDGYDSAEKRSQSDSLIIPFKNLINDAYCKDISIKIRSQLEIKRKKGEYIGSFAAYGYLKDPQDKNKLIVDPFAAEVVRSIFRWKLEGMSQSKIADKLNNQGILCPMEYKLSLGMKTPTKLRVHAKAKWSAVTVSRILTNELYIGVLIQGKTSSPNYKVKKLMPKDESEWVRIENSHEAIIDHEDFVAVRSLLKRDVRTSPAEDAVYLFSGFLSCADCGQNMIRKTIPSGKKKYVYYVCATNKAGKGCSAHSISEPLLEQTVLEAIRVHINMILNLERLLNFVDDLPEQQRNVFNFDAQIVKLKEEIERNQKFKLKLYENLTDGIINQEEYFQFKQSYASKISDAEASIIELEKEREAAVAGNKADLLWIGVFKKHENIHSLDRKVIVELIDHIEVHEGNRIEIFFKYQDECARAIRYIRKLSETVELPTAI